MNIFFVHLTSVEGLRMSSEGLRTSPEHSFLCQRNLNGKNYHNGSKVCVSFCQNSRHTLLHQETATLLWLSLDALAVLGHPKTSQDTPVVATFIYHIRSYPSINYTSTLVVTHQPKKKDFAMVPELIRLTNNVLWVSR
jgi:hypothetical protein